MDYFDEDITIPGVIIPQRTYVPSGFVSELNRCVMRFFVNGELGVRLTDALNSSTSPQIQCYSPPNSEKGVPLPSKLFISVRIMPVFPGIRGIYPCL